MVTYDVIPKRRLGTPVFESEGLKDGGDLLRIPINTHRAKIKAYGLKCHNCVGDIGCSTVVTCPFELNRCSSVEFLGLKIKTCMSSELCVEPIKCCSQDLCNSAMPAGSSPLLLLLSSAIISVFL